MAHEMLESWRARKCGCLPHWLGHASREMRSKFTFAARVLHRISKVNSHDHHSSRFQSREQMSAFAPVQESRTALPLQPHFSARNLSRCSSTNQALKSRRYLSDNPAHQLPGAVRVCESRTSLAEGEDSDTTSWRWGSSGELHTDIERNQLARVGSLAFQKPQLQRSSTRDVLMNWKPTEDMDNSADTSATSPVTEDEEIGLLREKIDSLLGAIVKVVEKVSRENVHSDTNVSYWFVHHTESRLERELISLGRRYEEAAAKLRRKLDVQQESRLCQICLSREQECLAVPCMHLEYCTECVAKNLIALHGQDRRCPTCKCKITAVLQCKVLPDYECILYGDWRDM